MSFTFKDYKKETIHNKYLVAKAPPVTTIENYVEIIDTKVFGSLMRKKYILKGVNYPFFKKVQATTKIPIRYRLNKFYISPNLENFSSKKIYKWVCVAVLDALIPVWDFKDEELTRIQPFKKCVFMKLVHLTYPKNYNSSLFSFRYKANSCYIDSLTTIFLFSDSLFMKKITTTIPDYDVMNVYRVCDRNPKSGTYPSKKQLIDLSKNIRRSLIDDYSDVILGRKYLECENYRKYVRECIPTIYSSSGGWEPFEIYKIYSFFSSILGMEIKIPRQRLYIKDAIGIASGDLVYERVPYADLSDFIFSYPPYPIEGTNHSIIRWDLFNEDTIVIAEQPGLSYIHDPTSISNFGNEVYSTNTIQFFILNSKYELTAMAVLLSERPDQTKHSTDNAYFVDLSGHYVSYIRHNNKWYYYNDTNIFGKLQEVDFDKIPKGGVLFVYTKSIDLQVNENLEETETQITEKVDTIPYFYSTPGIDITNYPDKTFIKIKNQKFRKLVIGILNSKNIEFSYSNDIIKSKLNNDECKTLLKLV